MNETTPSSSARRRPAVLLLMIMRTAMLAAIASGPLAIALGKHSAARSLRLIGITPITYTSYEGDESGFEPFAYGSDIDVVVNTASPATSRAQACEGGLTGDVNADDAPASREPRRTRRSGRKVSLSGFSTQNAPGTQHHSVALLTLLKQPGDRHRMLCAGGDGYALREVTALRRMFGVLADELLISVDLEAHHAGAGANDGRDPMMSSVSMRVDCCPYWANRPSPEDPRMLPNSSSVVSAGAVESAERHNEMGSDRLDQGRPGVSVPLWVRFCGIPVACVVALEMTARLRPQLWWRLPERSFNTTLFAFLALLVAAAMHWVPGAALSEAGGVVVVTGATSGVGRDVAVRLLSDGFHVVAVTRQRESKAIRLLCESTTTEGRVNACRGRIKVVRMDLSTEYLPPSSVDHIVSAVSSSDLRLVGVVHAAGAVSANDSISDFVESRAAEAIRLHLSAPLRLTQALLPLLRLSAGRAVFVSSMAAHYPAPAQLTYGASKAAQEWAAHALRREFASWGGSASVILPGSIGAGASLMCGHPEVCNVHPSDSTTPAVMHALLDEHPRARYPTGPVSKPLLLGRWFQIPAWLAQAVARPVPDEVIEFFSRMVNHPFHGYDNLNR